MPNHIAVWLDHKEARVFTFSGENAVETTVHARPHNDHHKHTRGQEMLKEHPEDIRRFFRELSTSLTGAKALLIVGPGAAKLEYIRHLHEHERVLEGAVVGIETVDHPSDGQLIAYAKTYFSGSDRMT